MRRIAAAALFAFLALAGTSAAADITGVVTHVEDGDTFSIGATRIRICGVDAPEAAERGGDDSFDALYRLIKGKTLHCVPVGAGTVCDGRSAPTSHRRVVAQCFLDGADIAATMVRRGFACDWPRFSAGAYKALGCTRR